MVKQVVWSAERSFKNLRSDAASVGKSTNTAWSVAKKTPLFMRKPKYVGSGKSRKRAMMTNRFGKEVPVPQRANRCVRTSVFKALLSGAAENANDVLKYEGGAFKTDVVGEATVAAALPKLSIGAEIMLEHAIGAYAKTVFDASARIKDSMNMHGKVSMGCMQAACEIVNRAVFASGLAPGAVVFDTVTRSKAKKAGKASASGEAEGEAEKADA